MKKITVLIISLLISCLAFSQGFNIEWKSLTGEGQIDAEYGTVASVKAIKGSIRVSGRSFKVRKASAARLYCKIADANTAAGPNATVVRIIYGRDSFSFFLRDVNSATPIWIPEYQVVVLPDGDNRSYDEVVKSIADRGLKSKYDRINAAPEASFEEAVKTTRSMSAPMWLGISRDMRHFEFTEEIPDVGPRAQESKQIVPMFVSRSISNVKELPYDLYYNYSLGRGIGPYDNIKRSVEEGTMPIYHSDLTDDDVVYSSVLFASLEKSVLTEENVPGTHYLLSDKYAHGRRFTPGQIEAYEEMKSRTAEPAEEVVLYVHTIIKNTADVPRYAWFKAPGLPKPMKSFPYTYDPATGISSFDADSMAFCVSKMNGEPLVNEEMSILLQPGDSVCVDFCVPHSPLSMERARNLAKKSCSDAYKECRSYWKKKLDSAAKITVPEQTIQNLIYAGLLHMDIVTYGAGAEGALAAYVGEYSPIGTESTPIIQYYESMGWTEEARRSLLYFLETQQEDGRIMNFGGYAIETGAVLWAIGEHYRYTHDSQWIESIKPQLLKACSYLSAWRNKSLDPRLKGRGYGMIDGKVADPVDEYHQFMLNAYAYLGINRTAEMLEGIGACEAAEIGDLEKSWKNDILESFATSLSLSPVVPLGDGSWCPTCAPWTESSAARFFYQKAEKYFSHATFTTPDGLLGPLHLLFAEIVDPASREGQMVLKYCREILLQGNSGFSQPYYTKYNMIQSRLGSVKPFLNTYYYTVAPHFDHETGTFWEHYFKATFHKTHEEGNFLMETRQMLYMEDGDTLHLLRVIPRKWMEDGKEISLDGVKCYFGDLKVKAVSHVAAGSIEASVECPGDRKPSTVTIRLPHPEGIKARNVQGGTYYPETETVEIRDFNGSAKIKLEF